MAAIYTFPARSVAFSFGYGQFRNPDSTLLEGLANYGAMARTPGAVDISWPRVHAFRLRRHHLSQRAGRGDLATVAGDVCVILEVAEEQPGITVGEVRAAGGGGRGDVGPSMPSAHGNGA